MDFCPNKNCSNSSGTPKDWYVKIGYYKPKTTNQKTPRYKCKSCGKSFSTHTNKFTANQKKPEIDKMLFKLLVSSVSLRRASQILDVEYNTIVKHFGYLAQQFKKLHKEHLKTIQTSFVMVDEMETFIHARPKALSVPTVVRIKTGEILGFAVAKMPAKGLLAKIGIEKYQWYVDERPVKFQGMLIDIKQCFKEQITIKSDGNSSYPKWIKNQVPNAQTEKVLPSDEKIVNEQGKEFEQLFAINNTFAKMRHDISLIKKIAEKDYQIKTTKSLQKVQQVNLKSLKGKLYYLNKSLIKVTKKLTKLKDINESGNPHLCFGSKKLFKQQFEINKSNNLTRLKTKQDWDKLWFQSRNKTFSLVGSSDETSGNMNCQLQIIDNEHTKNNIFELKVNLYPKETKLNDRYLTVKVKVHNDVKNYLLNLLNNSKYKEVNKEIKQSLTYRFYRNYNSKVNKFNDYKIFISLDKSKQAPQMISSKKLGTIGIDINANHISMTEVDRNGNLLFAKDFQLNLKDKKDKLITSNKSTNNISLAVKAMTDYAIKVNKPMVIENLNFSQKKLALKSGVNKNYNSMLSSFAYSKIIQLFKSRCFDKGLELIEVNPAYTSKIGKFKYQNLYKLTTHQAASLVIARRGLLSYEKTVKIKITNKQSKEVTIKDKVVTVINKEKTISNRISKYYPFELPVRNIQMKSNIYWSEVEQNYNKAKKNRILLKRKKLIPDKQDLSGEISLLANNFGVQALESTVTLNPDLISPF